MQLKALGRMRPKLLIYGGASHERTPVEAMTATSASTASEAASGPGRGVAVRVVLNVVMYLAACRGVPKRWLGRKMEPPAARQMSAIPLVVAVADAQMLSVVDDDLLVTWTSLQFAWGSENLAQHVAASRSTSKPRPSRTGLPHPFWASVGGCAVSLYRAMPMTFMHPTLLQSEGGMKRALRI